MNPEQRQRAEDVFLRVAQAPGGDRAALLESLCNGDSALRAEVLSLLEYHQEDSDFLTHGLLGSLGEEAEPEPPLAAGTRVAGFTLGAPIGSGGHGIVYVAEQERPRRTVALKLIRPGVGSSGLLRRFEREAEVLGRLQHPGIAQVYEAGTADLSAAGGPAGQPFIAMELIKGSPLTEHADRRALDLHRRLELVALVCDAVQHAHQRGVIHRDLKPANILVDETGQPKVLDFGVARATGADTHVSTLRTGVGQLVGTLSYMSPEQVLADPAEVDTRADVYALGVILYQLLTGKLPLDLAGRPLPEAARIIRDDEPARPASINRALRGEVETIITKALAKDRSRRYQSPADLAQDLRWFLDGRPIAARHDSALYILRKQLRRHRGPAAAAAVFLVLLIGFAIYAQVQSSRNARLALAERAANTRIAEELLVSNTERGRLYGRTGKIAAAEDLLWSQHLKAPDSPSTIWALWDLYSRSHCVAMVRGHTKTVWRMEFSPDGTRLYSAGADHTVGVWDPRTGRRLDTWTAGSAALGVSVRPDGKEVASSHESGWVAIWDVKTGKARLKFESHKGSRTLSIAYSPDGTRLVTGGGDGRVLLFDAVSGRPLGEVTAHEAGVRDLCWSGDRIASCDLSTSGATISTVGGNARASRVLPNLAVHAVSLTPDAGLLAAGNGSLTTRLVDTMSGAEAGGLRGPTNVPRWLKFTQDGARLVIGCWWTIEVWDVAGRTQSSSIGLRESPFGCAVSRDGTMLAAGYQAGWIQFWDLSDHGAVRRLADHYGRTESTITPDGSVVVTGDERGTTRLYGTADGRLLARLPWGRGRTRCLLVSPDGLTLAIATDQGYLMLMDLATGTIVAELGGLGSPSQDAVSFSPDGARLAVVMGDGSVEVRELPGLRVAARRAPVSDPFQSVCFAPGGEMLAMIETRRILRFWKPATGETPAAPDVSASSLSFRDDGQAFVASGSAGGVFLHNLESSGAPLLLGPSAETIAQTCFLPGEPWTVAVGGGDGTVRLFDAASQRELIALESRNSWESLAISFSADRRFMVTSGHGGAVAIWDLRHFLGPIAANAEYQIARLHAERQPGATEVRRWAELVLEPGDAASPRRGGVDLGSIEAWGRATLQDPPGGPTGAGG